MSRSRRRAVRTRAVGAAAMTFRTRLVLAATAAVLVVVLGSIATYLVAYNSLVGFDRRLAQRRGARRTSPREPVPGHPERVQSPRRLPPGRLSSTAPSTSRTAVSCRSTTRSERSAASGGQAHRTLTSRPPSTTPRSARSWSRSHPATSTTTATTASLGSSRQGGALQITTPLTGVNHELHNLAIALWLIVLVGVTVAVLLGLAVGRTVLRPLNSLTHNIEYLAGDHRRLEPARPGRRPTSSAGCGGRSTSSSTPSTPRGRASASSCSTPPTSCAHRSPASGPTWRSPAAWTSSHRRSARS